MRRIRLALLVVLFSLAAGCSDAPPPADPAAPAGGTPTEGRKMPQRQPGP